MYMHLNKLRKIHIVMNRKYLVQMMINQSAKFATCTLCKNQMLDKFGCNVILVH